MAGLPHPAAERAIPSARAPGEFPKGPDGRDWRARAMLRGLSARRKRESRGPRSVPDAHRLEQMCRIAASVFRPISRQMLRAEVIA